MFLNATAKPQRWELKQKDRNHNWLVKLTYKTKLSKHYWFIIYSNVKLWIKNWIDFSWVWSSIGYSLLPMQWATPSSFWKHHFPLHSTLPGMGRVKRCLTARIKKRKAAPASCQSAVRVHNFKYRACGGSCFYFSHNNSFITSLRLWKT